MAVPRPSFARLLATAATAFALLLLAAVLALWAASFGTSGGVEWIAHGPGGEFHLVSRDGRLLVGIFAERPLPSWRWGWRTSTISPSLRELVNNDKLVAAGDLWGWGVALPHWLVAALLAVVPAWWLVVHRDQSEQVRRRFGLCRHCGYDLSHSEGRCPECGALMAARVFRDAAAAAGSNGDGAAAAATSGPRTA